MMLQNIDISKDITIRESVNHSWYIFDRLCDQEIEVTPDELNGLAMLSEVTIALVKALEAYINDAEWVSTEFGDGYLAGGLTYENVKTALALAEGE